MNHSKYILDQELRPFFALHPAVANQIALQKRVRHVAAPKNGSLPRGVDQEGFYDSQSWKTDRVEIPSVLEWCVKTFKHPDLNNVVSLITPPTLTLLDDYDPYFKIRGIRLLSYIVSHVDPTLARRNGLGDVFFEALMTCLTYTTASSTEEPLFSAAVPCILSVADTIEIRGTLEYRQRFERILEKGILPAMASGGDRIAVRSVLMDGFPKVIGGIGMEVVRHLRVLIPLFCDTLELSILYPPRRDTQSSTSHLQPYTIQLSAAAALEKLVTVAWMRIPKHSGRILKAIATAWYRAKRDEVDASREGDRTELRRRNKIPVSDLRNALLEKLQNLCTLLLKCCGNVAKADMEALEKFDANMFQGLLSTSR